MAGFFTTVTDELRTVYRNVSERLSTCIQTTAYFVCSLYSENNEDVLTDGQELVELCITRCMRVRRLLYLLLYLLMVVSEDNE